jgi:hypothetical protein
LDFQELLLAFQLQVALLHIPLAVMLAVMLAVVLTVALAADTLAIMS